MRVVRLVVAVVGCAVLLGAMGYLALGRAAAPVPVFTTTPDRATESRSASFAYRVALRRPRFRCSLDGARWHRCRGRYHAAGLAEGRHRFCVTATAGRRRSRTACFAWRVGGAPASPTQAPATTSDDPVRATAPASFSMTATAVGALLPGGAAVPVDIAFTNPGREAITVEAVALAIDGGEPAACARHIRVVRELDAAPVVPGGSTRSLAQLGVPPGRWPQLAMVDDGTDQSACAGAAIRLALTGTARG